MSEKDSFGTGVFVQYDNVINSKIFLKSTIDLAKKIKDTGYYLTSDYIKALTDKDITHLLNLVNDQYSIEFGELFIIAEMLSNAEGLQSSSTAKESADRINALIGFLTLESLYRKKMIKLYHQNMSFGEEFKHLKIAELPNGKGLDDDK